MNGSLVLLAGVLLASGLVALVVALVPGAPRLEPALRRVGAEQTGPATTRAVEVGSVGSASERLGAVLYQRWPVPLTERQRQSLQLSGKSIAEFYADKIVMAVVGTLIPAFVLLGYHLMTGAITWWPAWVALVGGLVGFFTPDLLLRRSSTAARSRAVEALLVYIDLVTLERLANASATEALHNAAALSEVPLFTQIRAALGRARLEQQSPYGELRRLADQLDLPELVDVADVMQLDESGAALSGALRARVKELRDAHLTAEQIAASAAAEGMTIYMTIPALIFGLIFLVAALLTLLTGEAMP